MISTDDRNRSYGAGDQGFVPGEAVGTVILKPLSAARRDGDPIQAVIRSSAFEHSGRSNGFSAPNPKSQADLIHETMVKAGIGAETIGYVEGHGTGTRLGDSLEVASLQQAFLRHTSRRSFCSLGSVKSNVGHSESAAGISGLAKILLQMKHGKIAPSIGAEEVNPDIDFAQSPFFLQKTLGDWPQGDGQAPKRALLNSFGAGGVNACLLVEEYIPGDRAVQDETPGESLTILSAHTRESLLTLSADLARYLARDESISLPEICHTLQVGREHLRHRLAIRFSTRSELLQALKDREGARVYASEIDPSLPKPDLAAALEARDWHTLAMAWVRGAHVPWEKLYAGRTLSRLPLPMYPFAKHSHWIETRQASGPSAPNPAKSGLHPLVTCNSSSFSEIGFTSFLSESSCHAADHVVKGRRILPGSALLEMACVSANLAGRKKVAEVRDLVWSLPLELGEGTLPVRTVLNQEQDAVSVRIFTLDMDNEERLHAESRIVYEDPHAAPHAPHDRVDLEALKRKAMTYDGRRCYAEFEKSGIQYGPAFRTIQEMSVGESFALARLAVPDHLISDFYDYILHPALLDGAFQTLIGLGKPETASLHIPFAVGAIEIKGVLPPTCYALARFAEKAEESPSAARVATFDVDLINEDGEALTRIRKFYARIVENTLQEHK
jgi:polyketide synthase PksN